MMSEKFYTPKQVAEILQVHQYTVLKWIREGKLRALKFGRVYRTTESELKTFLGNTAHDSAQDIIRSSTQTLDQVTLPIPTHISTPDTLYVSASPISREKQEAQESYRVPEITENRYTPSVEQVYSLNIET